MGLMLTWSVVLVSLILTCSTYCRVLKEENGFPLGIVVKRQAVSGAQEPEAASSVVPTEQSLLDVFSTSSLEPVKHGRFCPMKICGQFFRSNLLAQKEKKPLKAVMQSLHAVSNITCRYAKTRIESKILNPAEVAQEVFFDVIIPETAFISGFSMEIDGKVYEAYVKEKQQAQKVYDMAVKQGITAGHVKQSARDSNRFSVSVNVEPQKKVKFNLTYEELLERRFGSYRHIINLNPGQLVEDVSVEIFVQENKQITGFRVPNFQSGNEIYPELDAKDFDQALTERISPTEVKVSFRPSVEDQKKLRKKSSSDVTKSSEILPEGMSGQFSIEYDVERDPSGGEVLVNDGYFVHFFGPTEGTPLKKHVIFVLDVSGSMDGRKIEQLKQAMDSILSELKPNDFFNIIEFAYSISVRDLDSPELTAADNPWLVRLEETNITTVKKVKPFPATPEYIQKGKDVVKRMTAAGGTNIYDALNVALDIALSGTKNEIVKRSPEEDDKYKKPEPMIIFLTDGEPTVGVTSDSKIIKSVDEKNAGLNVPIFSLAFGNDADFALLKKLSLISNAFARQIYTAADTSLQLTNFYKQISSPVLSDVKFVYPAEEVNNETVTKMNFANFFGGSELVVTGKLRGEEVSENFAVVEARAADGIKNFSVIHVDCAPPVLKTERNYRPLERLWVYMTIKQLLNEAELMKARSYLVDYKQETKPLQLAPEEKALRLALEGAKKAVYSFVRIIIECLTAKLRMVQSLFRYLTNDYVYVDSNARQVGKSINEIITDLAVKYSFVCPLTSLVVVKPGSLTDADVEPAVSNPAPPAFSKGQSALFKAPSFAAVLPLQLGVNSMSFSAMRAPYAPAEESFDMYTTQKDGLSTTTPVNAINDRTSHEFGTLESITWLNQVLAGDVLHFPGDVNATEYLLGRNQANDVFGNCTLPEGESEGVCRHLEHCVTSSITSDVSSYYPNYFCLIPGNYAGVCCSV